MKYNNIVFIHVPKTAGTAVNQTFRTYFPLNGYADFIDACPYESIRFFQEHQYVSGHIRLAQILPFIDRSKTYIFTLIREPVKQLLSHLHWAKSKTTGEKTINPEEWDPFYRGLFYDVASLDLQSADALALFVRSFPHYNELFDNQQTRFFLNNTSSYPIGYSDFKVALANVRSMNLAGPSEKVQEVVAQVFHDNGENLNSAVQKVNVNHYKSFAGEIIIDAEIKAALASAIMYDQLLYEEAANLFLQKHRGA